MNCVEHDDRSAVAQCVQCGVGICKECEANTIFRIDNKALCRKCNYGIACENDRIFKAGLKTRQNVVIVNVVTFSVGMLVYFIAKMTGNTDTGMIFLLLSWFIGGLVANIMLRLGIDSLKKEKTLKNKIVGFIGELIGMTLACPLFIISGLIGMYRIKKQIAENDATLSQFDVENN